MAARKILLVDDSETILQMEQLILANEPYELLVARDGVEGVTRALQDDPDLILMMSSCRGWAVLKRYASCGGTNGPAACRSSVVTSKAEADCIETGYVSGCNDYIVKTIDSMELIAKVRDLLGE